MTAATLAAIAHAPDHAACAGADTAAVPGWCAITAHRDFLVRYAARRLSDPLLAEDLVHDVFEAVMTGRASFGGRASLRSWLVAILKHKIVDLIRQRSGQHSLEAMCDEEGEPSAQAFESPAAGPEAHAEQRQRLRHTLARIAALPDSLRHAVELRLLQDRDTEEVCQALAISQENLFVRLHRARRQLSS